MASISDKSVNQGSQLTFTATATDTDLPANTLTFSLVNPPTGATINASTGSFSWTPSTSGSFVIKVNVSDGSLTNEKQFTVTVNPIPKVTIPNISISGGTGTTGAFKVGDTVTAIWNNTAAGDNNTGITNVRFNFSEFGGGTAVAGTNSNGIWTATYTLTSGSIDANNRNVSVTATNAYGSTTATGINNAIVDSVLPIVTDANISISGATGLNGNYITGNIVTATWNNSPTGNNNLDIITSVTFNFSQFGGGSAVSATNIGNIWTASYTITAGNIKSTGLNVSVTVTDNAGNSITIGDSSNATVDNSAPTVTSIIRVYNELTNAASANYTINFSESITGLDTDDFNLTKTGTANGTVASVSGSGSTYTITVNSITGNGTLRLDLKNAGTNITDAAGNALTSGFSGQSYTIDTQKPTASLSSSIGVSGSQTTTSPIPFTVTFSESVVGFSLNGVNVTNATLSGLSGSGTTYTFNATPVVPGDITVSIKAGIASDAATNTNLVSTSYTINYQTTLPVTLVSYKATVEGNYSKLNWLTSSENNNKGFEIYRSGENTAFVKIGEVVSKGKANSYTYVDKQPLNGNNYYRLVQVDNDGATSNLGERMLNFELSSINVKVYPNPTVNKANITFAPGNYQSISLNSLDGRVLQIQQISATQVNAEIDLAYYPAGVYFISVQGTHENTIRKIVKQ